MLYGLAECHPVRLHQPIEHVAMHALAEAMKVIEIDCIAWRPVSSERTERNMQPAIGLEHQCLADDADNRYLRLQARGVGTKIADSFHAGTARGAAAGTDRY